MSEPADWGEARVLTEGLAHFWHPVEYSADVTDRPVAVKLLERPLALWRSNGGIVAFHDLCVHRGTPLSLGSVCRDEIVCAYHGWHYRSDGACTRIPSLPSTRPIPTRARATAYRADERYGLVWVCLDEPRAAIPPFPPESEDPTFSWAENYLTREAARVKANAARFVENMMDVAHFPWVHEGILGTRDDAEIADVAIETTATGFEYEVESNFSGSMMMDRDRPIRRHYEIIMPFTLILRAHQPGRPERQIVWFVASPVSVRETRFFRFAGRNYRHQLPPEQLGERAATIAEQDRRIVEAQRPEELPLDLSEELHLKGPDGPAVEYRRRLRQLGISWE